MTRPPQGPSATTVIRPRPGGASPVAASRYRDLAAPVLAVARALRDEPVPDIRRALAEAQERLRRFEAAAAEAGIPPVAVAPARYGLAVVLDSHARANRAVPLEAWSAGARSVLFEGRDVSLPGLRDLHRKALGAGPAYAGLAEFLSDLIAQAGHVQAHRPSRRKTGRAVWIAGLALVTLGGLGALGWTDWRHHDRIRAEFDTAAAVLPVEAGRALPVLTAGLDRMAALAEIARADADAAPVGIVARFAPSLGAGGHALGAYRAAVAAALPGPLFAALDDALATEGEALALYDTLRARAILTGQARWQPAFLVGWAADRDARAPGLAALAGHIPALAGAPPDPPATDDAVLALARQFAGEAGEDERAFLELIRSEPAAALPGWQPARAIPGLADVAVRRSGLGLDAPIPGIFTGAGWAFARDIGTGVAVQEARAQADLVLGGVAPRRNDTPDLVMDLLQRRTLDVWREFLSDLRVRPFTDAQGAILISGTLARRQSPLTQLLQAVWVETGGTDRSRSHPNQLAVATEFGAMIQFIEQGRMANISNLFAALNVALGAMDEGGGAGLDRLMSVQQRATSIAALQTAPTVVVQIIEDVLAQTAAAHKGALQTPLTRLWQVEVAQVCAALTAASYPFGPGPDADITEFAAIFGPDGALDRFFRLHLAHLIDTSTTPWRWKPEAALSGLSQESAAFFQTAAAVRAAFFGPDGRAGRSLTLATLAERGTASMTIGGASAPVRATGTPEPLAWPGPQPGLGVTFAVRNGADTEEVAYPGPWGLFRMLDPLRLRARDDGQRFLIDLRFERARFFLEMRFDTAANPVSHRPLLSGLACPADL